MEILLVNGSNYALEVLSSKLSKELPRAHFTKAKYLNIAFNETLDHAFDLIIAGFQLPFAEAVNMSQALSNYGDNHKTPTILFASDKPADGAASPEIADHVTITSCPDELIAMAVVTFLPPERLEQAA